ncbi:MAG: hypothetical protein GXO77_12030 [Calditrichaeota bacterium]|nr:hypothetical protein [Calditrichota bacterium]
MKKYFSQYKIHSRAFLIALMFAIFVGISSVAIYISLNRWKAQVINNNMVLSEVFAEQLNFSSKAFLDSLESAGFFTNNSPTVEEMEWIDKRLKKITSKILSHAPGMEGGFYICQFDKFFGYANPTSPPPIPVYGPPPRSYNIIKKQVLETVDTRGVITRLHQFDPAIFPLATKPIFANGECIGAVWARIHIERELPHLKLRQVINIGALIALLGFLIAVFSSLNLRKKIQHLHKDLEIIKQGVPHKIGSISGTLGYISRSINNMVEALNQEHRKREQLERQLHQKEKMASLGTLIAGVAHEVKTPLAILKTRIQMWQQDLKDHKISGITPSFSEESMQLVINEVNRLDGLVKRLLYFSRPISDRIVPTQINDLLEQTIRFIQTNVKKDQYQIEYIPDKMLPPVNADPNALEQVFINIIMNSIEAISDGGKISILTEAAENKKKIRVWIVDNGCGIPEKYEQKIFDPFFTTKDKGFGLGLSISYEIVTAHNGSITFYQEKPAGTRCLIEFPINNSQEKKFS